MEQFQSWNPSDAAAVQGQKKIKMFRFSINAPHEFTFTFWFIICPDHDLELVTEETLKGSS